MKKIILSIICLTGFYSFCQSSIVFTENPGISAPPNPQFIYNHYSGLAIKNNFLYFASVDGNKIRKIDLSLPSNQIPTDLITINFEVSNLIFNGDELYISSYTNGIKKINTNLSNPVLIDVVLNSQVRGMEIIDNYLYYCDYTSNRISKIDLNSTLPMPVTFINFNYPDSLKFYNNYLYINNTSNIYKVNLLDPALTIVPVTNSSLNSSFSTIIYNNILYFEHYTWNSNSLLSKNLSDPNSTISYVGVSWIVNYGINKSIMQNGIIYHSATNGIVKFDLNQLSLNNFNLDRKIEIYPNPATDYVTIKNLEKPENIKIINSLGQIIKTIKVNVDEVINIEEFKTGIYYIKTENSSTYKLLKK